MSIYYSGSWAKFVQKEYIGLGNLSFLQGDFMLHVDIFEIGNWNFSHQSDSTTNSWSAWGSRLLQGKVGSSAYCDLITT